MEIFGVGGAEFILILLIMLIVAGPKRMIHWSYQLGVYAGKLRHIWSQVAEGLEQEMRNEGLDIKIPRDITNKAQLNQFIRQQARPLSDSVDKTFRQDIDAVRSVQQTVRGSAKASGSVTGTASASATASYATAQSLKDSMPADPVSDQLGVWSNSTAAAVEATTDVADDRADTIHSLGTWAASK